MGKRSKDPVEIYYSEIPDLNICVRRVFHHKFPGVPFNADWICNNMARDTIRETERVKISRPPDEKIIGKGRYKRKIVEGGLRFGI